MKKEIAEQLAASVVATVTIEDAGKIIQEFLNFLARCPVCENTGRFTYDRDTEVDVEILGKGRKERGLFRAGTTVDCPRCADRKCDPDYVTWYCTQDDAANCPRRPGNAGEGDGHDKCGWRLMVPHEVGEQT